MVGWIPLSSRFEQTFKRDPAITTTEVVPSPASTSCAFDISTSFSWLVMRKVSYHFCCRMNNSYLIQYCGSIICDDNLSFSVLNHFVHSARPQWSSNYICKCFLLQISTKYNLHFAAAMFVSLMFSVFWLLLKTLVFFCLDFIFED